MSSIYYYLYFAFCSSEKSVELLTTGCYGKSDEISGDLITYIFVKVAERRNVDYFSLRIESSPISCSLFLKRRKKELIYQRDYKRLNDRVNK